MKTVEKYSQDMKNKNTSLTNENQNLSSAFIMLDEIKNRALSTITLNALMSFIDTMMNNQIDFAYQKLEFSSESLNLIKNEIDDIFDFRCIEAIMKEVNYIEYLREYRH